jgi:hypothetical protein
VVAVRWESPGDSQLLDEVVLEPDGSFSTTITVPADAGAEPYRVSASCRPGPGFDEISASAVLVVVTPPGPITSSPPPTSDPQRTTGPIGAGPIGAGPIGAGPAPVPPPTPVLAPAPESVGTASPQVEPTASEALPAAFVSILVLGLGLFGLTRAVRSRQRFRGHSISAVAAPAPPGALDVRPLGPERTVALRVALHADPGVLTVHDTKE